MQSSLNNDILFSMNSPANFGLLSGGYTLGVSQAAQFQTIMKASWGSVVTGSQNMLISNR
jgi:hypothetical protein